MSSIKIINNLCRICLGDKDLFNWDKEIFDFCGITYKDCYYNYVHLNESYSNSLPNQLCEMCGNELRNAHFLFERALESYYILRNCINSKALFTDYSDFGICQKTPDEEIETESYQSVEYMDTGDMETFIKNSICSSDNVIDNDENRLNESQDVLSNVEEIDGDNFENINKFESTPEVLLKSQFCLLTDAELTKSSYNKNENGDCSSVTSNLDEDEQFSKYFVSENSEETIINYQPTSENSLEENIGADYEPTVNKSTKIRKKYILICQYCSLEVDGANQLKKHEATHNENRERTHTCTKCGLKLYTQGSLNEHMKIHDENRKKNHKCEFCEKAFYNKGALNVHRRVHLGLMFKCQICPKEFFRQIDLDKHLPTHSASSLTKNVVKKRYLVQCQYCNKSVLTNKLKEHMAIHSNQPQMKCKICDKQFYDRRKCVNHLRRFHRKEKSEYDDYIHNFVNSNRISLLRIKQASHVETITIENP